MHPEYHASIELGVRITNHMTNPIKVRDSTIITLIVHKRVTKGDLIECSDQSIIREFESYGICVVLMILISFIFDIPSILTFFY